MQQQILDFWFGAAGEASHGQSRNEWFRKDPAFDALIAARFGELLREALDGGLETWSSSPRGSLALIILLDQFTRNVHRDTAPAFSGDRRALAVARAAVDRGDDHVLIPVERWFLYMPFVHAEDEEAQQRSLELFTRLRDETGLAEPLLWAEKHAVVIRRFGRYPHRNALLGRSSTAEEEAFLHEPGSRF
jgi:uncharacterized protein (DUF924 family)